MDWVVIFFVTVASVLCFQLFRVLGTRGGHAPQREDAPDVATTFRPTKVGEPVEPEKTTVVAAPLPAWAATIAEVDAGFDPGHFRAGAAAAYEMIVTAFARGELSAVRPYLAPDVLNAFEGAVAARLAAQQSLELTFVGLHRHEVVSSRVADGKISVVVDFQSDQSRVLRTADGQVVDGDPRRIDRVHDRWTFVRSVGARDPNWMLAATDAATAGA